VTTDERDERSEPLPEDAIDVEDRLRRVKQAAGRPRLRRRLARLAGEPERAERVLIVAAGSACATTVVLTYLWWRDGRRGSRRGATTRTRARMLRHTVRT
jgi:hypothetical protein